jgi:hypothetical protein
VRSMPESDNNGSGAQAPSNWFVRQRQAWIADMLRVYGFINREHLEKMFGISTPQASIDLNRFLRLFPELMTYNASAKRYEANTCGAEVGPNTSGR